jgi:hypothetical protein
MYFKYTVVEYCSDDDQSKIIASFPLKDAANEYLSRRKDGLSKNYSIIPVRITETEFVELSNSYNNFLTILQFLRDHNFSDTALQELHRFL